MSDKKNDAESAGVVQVELAAVRRVCLALLDEAERIFGDRLRTSADLYWTVDLRGAYALADPISEHVESGSLVDDIDSLREILDRAPGEVYLWHDLLHVIGLLGAVAYESLPRDRRDSDR